MPTFSIQYLEDGPHLAGLTPVEVRDRLRAAFERLPITLVLVGWNLPSALFEVCADECTQAGAQLYRWHPLLTGDGVFMPRPAWQVIGVDGDPVPGFMGMPEFTFVCPNRPAVREAVLAHVRDVLRDGRIQGIFLDRMRYPSPVAGPDRVLGCFCPDCQQAAAVQGIDLESVRQAIKRLAATPAGAAALVRGLLVNQPALDSETDLMLLHAFLDFRAQTITQFVTEVAAVVHELGRQVGLDCFSPALTRLVGQDLDALNQSAAWIKIMSYGHTLGPAGIPFELLGLADWLVERQGMREPEALALLAAATSLPLPPDRKGLRTVGLAPETLRREAQRARQAGVSTLLAGIELVELAGVAELNPAQITADLAAFKAAGVDGLALSWDLWVMPLDRLDLVREVWS